MVGIAGTQVTITGSGFGATQGSGNVWLGNTYGVVVSWSDTQVVAVIAPGAQSGVAQVFQGGVWSNSMNLTVVTPVIASVTPTTGIAGAQVTITGSGFGATQSGGRVWLGSTYGVVVSWSDTQVIAAIASGAQSGVAQILQGGAWSNSVNLTVTTPNITSVSPTTGTAGTQVTITGSGFGAAQGGNVWLGSTYGAVVSWSDTQVVATIASGAQSGVAQILQGGVWSNSVNLTVVTPNIASVTPTSGIAGTQVTISGSGFGAAQGSGNVWLGNTYGVVVSWSNTQVIATIASGAQSGVAQILQGGVWSNSVNLTVITPNITNVTPTTGTAGTQVTITGTGFGASQGNGNVWLGNTYGVVTSWSDTQVVATIASGAQSGVAQILQGGVWSNSANLNVITPFIATINPTSAAAGMQVTITGAGFGTTQGNGNVWLGSTYGAVVSWSDTQIIATIASGAQSGVAQVLQGGVWSNSINLIVPPLGIISIAPASGPVGSTVTIVGLGFGAVQGSGNVSIGNVQASVVSWSDTQIVANVAQGTPPGVVQAQVQQNGFASNAASFTVTVAGILNGSMTTTVTAVTLTNPNAIDWEHWGTADDQPLVRKAGITPILGDFSVIGNASPAIFGDGETEYLWNDGDPLESADRTTSGVLVFGQGNGFHLSVPAEETTRTLLLYVGTYRGNAQLTASLSDQSAASFQDSRLDDFLELVANGTYKIDFRASQPGQTLNIDFVLLSDYNFGNVTLQSAVLTPHLPEVAIASPSDDQELAVGSSIPVNVSASQLDNQLSSVGLFLDSQNVTQLSSSPFNFQLSGLAAGDHLLTAVATDSAGLTATSAPITVTSTTADGYLAGTVTAPTNVDLSAGSSDWIHWGTINNDPFSLDRKNGAAPQISNFTTLNNGDDFQADDTNFGSVLYSWSGGTQTYSQSGTGTQIYFQGLTNGFTLTVPADTTLRTFNLYLGTGQGESKVRAKLSNGGAWTWYHDTTNSYDEALYSWNFQASSPGQKLIVTVELVKDYGYGYVDLESAEVIDQNPPVISTISPTSGSPGTSIQISGSNFGTDSSVGSVLLNGNPVTVTSWSDIHITATVAGGGNTGPVVVGRGLANSNAAQFTYTGPVLQAISPSVGNTGTLVTITGANLSYSGGQAVVQFNGIQAISTVQSNSTIVATVPAGVPQGPLVVTAIISGVVTNQLEFDVEPPPVITSINPDNGITGTVVTISGNDFGPTQANSTINFGQVTATAISWSQQQIVVQVPPRFYGGLLSVTVDGMRSNEMLFRVAFRCLIDCNASPSSMSVSPAQSSVVIGETTDLQVIDNLGEEAGSVTWSINDGTLGQLNGEGSTVKFTASKAGTATITAQWGPLTSTAKITIYDAPFLADGTLKWSMPSAIAGQGEKFINAQPSPGLDTAVFSLDAHDPSNIIVRALSSSGRQVWAHPTGTEERNIFSGTFAPTPDGGITYSTDTSIIKVDPLTGYSSWSYPYPAAARYRVNTKVPIAVDYDGTVYSVVAPNAQSAFLVGIGAGGNEKFRIPLPAGDQTAYSGPLVLADGSLHLVVSEDISQAMPYANNPGGSQLTPDNVTCPGDVLECWRIDDTAQITTRHKAVDYIYAQRNGTYQQSTITSSDSTTYQWGSHYLYRPNPDYSGPPDQKYQLILKEFWGFSQGSDIPQEGFWGIQLVPDSLGGTIFTVEQEGVSSSGGSPAAWVKHVTDPHSPTSGPEFEIPVSNVQNVVVNDVGTAFASGLATDANGINGTGTLASFDPNSGSTNYRYDSTYAQYNSTPDIVAAGPNGSLYATDGLIDEPRVQFTLDSTGNRTDAPKPSQDVTDVSSTGVGTATSIATALDGSGVVLFVSSLIHRIPSSNFEPAPSRAEGPLHSVGLFWCGTGYSEQGTCGTPAVADDIRWGYLPGNDINQLQDFSKDHPDWVAALQLEALNTFKTAYSKYNIAVELGTTHSNSGTVVPDQEFTVYVGGDWPPPEAGIRSLAGSTSRVYYFAFLDGAKQALGHPETASGAGWVPFAPVYPPATNQGTNDFLVLLRATGRGIGNGAAHEIGHHLELVTKNGTAGFPYMDCGLGYYNAPGGPVACESNDNFVYNFFNSDGFPQVPGDPTSGGAQFFYLDLPGKFSIHWGPSNDCWLQNYGRPGSCKTK